jgi:hypothetical protein
VLKKILVWLSIVSFLYSNVYEPSVYSDFDNNETTKENQLKTKKVLYLSYDYIPKRVVTQEIFSITIKALSIINDTIDIKYTFKNFKGVKILNENPYREKKEKYFYDKFYFKALSKNIKLPDIKASVIDTKSTNYKPTFFLGK